MTEKESAVDEQQIPQENASSLVYPGQQPQIASKWLSDYFCGIYCSPTATLFPSCKRQICLRLLVLSTGILWVVMSSLWKN